MPLRAGAQQSLCSHPGEWPQVPLGRREGVKGMCLWEPGQVLLPGDPPPFPSGIWVCKAVHDWTVTRRRDALEVTLPVAGRQETTCAVHTAEPGAVTPRRLSTEPATAHADKRSRVSAGALLSGEPRLTHEESAAGGWAGMLAWPTGGSHPPWDSLWPHRWTGEGEPHALGSSGSSLRS